MQLQEPSPIFQLSPPPQTLGILVSQQQQKKNHIFLITHVTFHS